MVTQFLWIAPSAQNPPFCRRSHDTLVYLAFWSVAEIVRSLVSCASSPGRKVTDAERCILCP